MRCTRKTCHASKADAETAILRMLECCEQLPGTERLRAYQCADCGGAWHVGRRKEWRPNGGRVTWATLPRRRRAKEGVRP